jgi:hypothetical protein
MMLFAALVLVASATSVEPMERVEPVGLSVERATGAETCASAEELAEETGLRIGTAHLDPVDPGRHDLRFHVEFTRAGDSYRAALTAHGRIEGTRTIEDASSSCASLVEAVSLALAILVNQSSVEEATPIETPKDAPAATTETPAPPIEPASRFSVDVAGGAMLGVVRSVGPAFAAGVAWWNAHDDSIELDVEAIPPGDIAFAPGSVTTSFLGLRALACRRLFAIVDALAIDGCATGAIGRIAASASKYDHNLTVARPWFAAGLAVGLRGPIVGPLGWKLMGGADFQIATEAFTVTVNNADSVAYSPTRLAPFGALGLSWSIE